MIAYERRKIILQTLSSKGVVSLKELASKLDTSEITIRRDIEKLEAEGKLRRVQGGAASLEEAEEAELTMKQRLPLWRRHISAVQRRGALPLYLPWPD